MRRDRRVRMLRLAAGLVCYLGAIGTESGPTSIGLALMLVGFLLVTYPWA